jgi:mono/diheme cytochrome c family protein
MQANALLLDFGRRSFQREVSMRKAAIAILVVFCFAPISFSQDQTKDGQKAAPAEFKIPPEDAKRPNPVKPLASSIAEGKHLYESQCLMCHGKDGDGKGDLAEDMKLNLRDFRDPATFKDSTDGEIFYIISKGKGEMPSAGDRLSDTQCWNLINYIRSLSGKASAAKPKADKPKDDKAQP